MAEPVYILERLVDGVWTRVNWQGGRPAAWPSWQAAEHMRQSLGKLAELWRVVGPKPEKGQVFKG